MNMVQKEQNIVVTIENFSLADTLDCGQCFRFEKQEDGSYFGIVQNNSLHVRQIEDQLIFEHTTEQEFEQLWKDYFDLDTDYTAIQNSMIQDQTIKASCDYAGGIRILKQDPWEALCSFIISQNNNIPRIKGIISRLCEHFGEQLSDGYGFPTPDRLAACSQEDLSVLRAGFRSRYLLDAATKVRAGEIDFDEIYRSDIEVGRKSLVKICGVGPKVAECALLFGFHRLEAFPIDVWIKRALEYFYQDGFPEYAKPYGGIAQQYIFHYIRNCPSALPKEYRKA